jgi:hypothetical protein
VAVNSTNREVIHMNEGQRLRDLIADIVAKEGYDVYSKLNGEKENDLMAEKDQQRFHIVVWKSVYRSRP